MRNPAAAAPSFGYTVGALNVLKLASGNNQSGPIGPGNFQLIRLNGNGGSVIRQNMAGAYDSCVDGSGDVETQTGNVVGPVTQGLNTRFGDYSGGVSATDYPPDVVTTQPSPLLTYNSNTQVISQGSNTVTQSSQINFNHAIYDQRVTAGNYDNQPSPNGIGAAGRRILTVPIADCSGSNNGNSQLPVLGFGCYFLLQKAIQQGQDNYVYGEFVMAASAKAIPGRRRARRSGRIASGCTTTWGATIRDARARTSSTGPRRRDGGSGHRAAALAFSCSRPSSSVAGSCSTRCSPTRFRNGARYAAGRALFGDAEDRYLHVADDGHRNLVVYGNQTGSGTDVRSCRGSRCSRSR